MITKKEKDPLKNKPQPENMVRSLSAATGDIKGEINLQWDAAPEAKSYIVQISRLRGTAKESDWKHIDIVTESYCTIQGLKKGRVIGFRAAIISEKGQSKWCKAVYKKIE